MHVASEPVRTCCFYQGTGCRYIQALKQCAWHAGQAYRGLREERRLIALRDRYHPGAVHIVVRERSKRCAELTAGEAQPTDCHQRRPTDCHQRRRRLIILSCCYRCSEHHSSSGPPSPCFDHCWLWACGCAPAPGGWVAFLYCHKLPSRCSNRLRGESEVGVRFWFLQYIYIIYCPLVVWKYTKFSIHARAWWPSARANTRIAVW